jgi:hypothetical protein
MNFSTLQLEPAVCEVRAAVDVAKAHAQLNQLFTYRGENAIEIGRVFRSVASTLPKPQYKEFCEQHGHTPLTARVFILAANKADGILPEPAKPRKQRATMVVEEAVAFLRERREYTAADLLEDLSNGQN